MSKLNSSFYLSIYSDVFTAKLSPYYHYTNYGANENRFKNVRQFKKCGKISIKNFVEIFFIFLFYKFKYLKISFFSNLIKKVIIFFEIKKLRKLNIDFIMFSSWVEGGSAEVEKLYKTNLTKNATLLAFKTYPHMVNLESNPVTCELWENGKLIFKMNILFTIEILNKLILKRMKKINLIINNFFEYEKNLKNINFHHTKKVFYIINDYYMFHSNWHLYNGNSEERILSLPSKSDVLKRFEIIGVPNLLDIVDEFIAPSLDCYSRVSSLIKPNKIKIIYHPESPFIESIKVNCPKPKTNFRNVLILGNIGDYKGKTIVTSVIKNLEKNPNYVFHHIGNEIFEIKSSNYIPHGTYPREQIMKLIKDLNIDFAFLPFQSPETYSFTLSDIFLAQLPLVSTDIGAISERCYGRPHTALLTASSTIEEFVRAIEKVSKCEYSICPPNLNENYKNTLDSYRKRVFLVNE